MRSRVTILSLLLLLQLASFSQSPTNCILIENGDVVLYLDQRWTREEQSNAIAMFDMKDLPLDSLWKFQSIGKYSSDGWHVEVVSKYVVKILKSLDDLKGKFAQGDETVSFSDLQQTINYQTRATFGHNDFKQPVVVKTISGKTRFFLAGYKDASRVYLSGTFNEWSTQQTMMLKVDSGWVSDLSLAPGKHVYKYIIDGNWKADPNNRLIESDYHGGFNSVYFECNYTFELKGYTSARNVLVSGSFNEWNEGKARMVKTRSGWKLPMYLKDGTYTYKFIVDRNWIIDPSNPNKRDDGAGNQNSVLAIGNPVTFKLNGYKDASEVFLAGDFNDWNKRELPMKKISSGWSLDYVLSGGNYEYKFIYDGRWTLDPQNPYVTGSGDQTNSIMPVKPNHTFTLEGFTDAKDVRISGNFNNWAQHGYKMRRVDNGWIIDLNLPRGKCLYKFIIDGQWIIDPGNKQWEQNEFGTGNSVLWIDGQQ